MPRILKETYVEYIFVHEENFSSMWPSYVNKLKMAQLKMLSKIYEKQRAPPISEYNTTIE
jgi:hypothetical protein